ncbi:MAG: insulinase family protein [Lewinella sp.]|nr:insulinase family protein [Lewinella sp.]
MKRIIYSILCFGLLASSLVAQDETFRQNAPAPGPAPVIQMGDFVNFELDNGLQVIVVENHKLPRVSFRLFVDVPLHMEGEYVGTADIAGDLLNNGTTSRSKAEIDEAVDFIGANLNTFASGAFASCLTKHKEAMLDIMSDVIMNPAFPEEEFTKIRHQTLSGLATEKDDPSAIAGNLAQVLRYGKDYPYGEITTETTVKNITVDKCREYYNAYFRPNISYLVMVGDITVGEARTLAQQYFGGWQSIPVDDTYFRRPMRPEEATVNFVSRTDAVQSVVYVTYPIDLKPGTMDVITGNVMNGILGSSSSGRLFRNLREDKAFTYGAYSTLASDKNVGYFNASASVRNEVTDSAVVEFLYEMDRIRTEKVEQEELDRAKNYLTGSFARSLESPETVANYALNTIRYRMPRDYYPNYLTNLAKVTANDVLEIAQELITPDQANILVVGNKEVVPTLEQFAGPEGVRHFDSYGNRLEIIEMPAEGGMTAEAVIAKYVEAVGGQDKLNQVQDMTMVLSTNIQGMDMTMTRKQKEPGKFLMLAEMSGMVVNEVRVDGDDASMSQMGQAVPVDDETLESFQMQAEIFPEARWQELGYQAEMGGIENIDGTQAYEIRVTAPNGEQILDYYAMDSGLKIRSVVKGEGGTMSTDYADYKAVNGVLIPHTLTSTGMMPMPLVMEVQSASINTGVEDSEFAPE